MTLQECIKAWALQRLTRNYSCRMKIVGAWDGRKIPAPDPTRYERLKMWAIEKCLPPQNRAA